MKKIIETMLDLLYPRCCPICHRILKNQRGYLCPECRKTLRPIAEPRCKKCGKQLLRAEEEYCRDCAQHTHFFEEGIGIYSYDSRAHSSMMQYKFNGRREYGRFYSRAMAAYGWEYLKRWDPQVILPVPMHPKDIKKRGFHQGEDLARMLGELTGIPVRTDLVRKAHRTGTQKKLGAKARRKNLEKAFVGKEGRWPYARVLIVDDIYTTGSTVDALAKELQRHGVYRIFFLTVFIGKGDVSAV